MSTARKVEWEECEREPYLVQKNPTNNKIHANSPAEKDMHVFARYKNCDINLVITKVLTTGKGYQDEYEGTVFGTFPETDLKEGELVIIDRKHICTMFSGKQSEMAGEV